MVKVHLLRLHASAHGGRRGERPRTGKIRGRHCGDCERSRATGCGSPDACQCAARWRSGPPRRQGKGQSKPVTAGFSGSFQEENAMDIDVKRYLELSLPQRRKDVENEFAWLMEAAIAYARSRNAPIFPEAKRPIKKGASYRTPISEDEVASQVQAFTKAINAFFDEVSALRQITERHDEPQTDGTARTN